MWGDKILFQICEHIFSDCNGENIEKIGQHKPNIAKINVTVFGGGHNSW